MHSSSWGRAYEWRAGILNVISSGMQTPTEPLHPRKPSTSQEAVELTGADTVSGQSTGADTVSGQSPTDYRVSL